ncbi:hypothetical protein ZWY2020_026530 [Hordeum vulgare]|nr:hypothetical protein ZWY2020_026530 [Hordeum vulgare]
MGFKVADEAPEDANLRLVPTKHEQVCLAFLPSSRLDDAFSSPQRRERRSQRILAKNWIRRPRAQRRGGRGSRGRSTTVVALGIGLLGEGPQEEEEANGSVSRSRTA